ncbi:MAG: hypothetical protein NZ561_05110, partial [Phycisphaerae bacterium]|nr:hypothetical protein [Phycisphaerae bacterium]
MLVTFPLMLALFLDPSRQTLIEQGRVPVPPPMPRRAIAPPATLPAGSYRLLADGTVRYTLFLPYGYRVPQDGSVRLTVHFHTAPWFVIEEHLRRGLSEPLAIFALGEGSNTYRLPFEDPDRFDRILRQIERSLGPCSLGQPPRVNQVDITSFSAGYGAVRELVKQPRYVQLIRRIILADSLYAGWDPASTQPGATSRPAAENIDPWRGFVELAARGEKTFVLTHSMVPTRYASTHACAQALIEMIDAPVVEVRRGEIPATLDPDYPLLYRADLGRFHVWGYDGTDAGAHMTHARH